MPESEAVVTESRGSVVAVADLAPLPVMPCRCSVRLVAGEESLRLRYQPGDLHVSGLASGDPVVTFSELLMHNLAPEALPFMRRHDAFDVEYLIDGTPTGWFDRRMTVTGCHLVDVEIIEAEEQAARLRYTLQGALVDGDLLVFLGLRG